MTEESSVPAAVYRNSVKCQKLEQVFEVQSFISALTQADNCFVTRLLPCR